MRGAAFLTGLKDAIVVDIGGKSTDVGLLLNGFAREASAEVKVGGIRTNFRMPDITSIGLGGGSYVTHTHFKGQYQIKVGPQSAGYLIEQEALVFAQPGAINDRVLTATDIAVAAGIAKYVGLTSNVKHLSKEEVTGAVGKIHNMLSDCVDQMRFSDRDLPLILVGGGSIIVERGRKFNGISEILLPKYFDVANAVGAALSQISTSRVEVIDLENYIDKSAMGAEVVARLTEMVVTSEDEKSRITENIKKTFLQNARETAMDAILEQAKEEIIECGAQPDSVSLVKKEDAMLNYIPGNAARIKIKVVGDLKIDKVSDKFIVPESVFQREPQTGLQTKKQTITNTGSVISGDHNTFAIETPTIDRNTGEWLLSEYDIECLIIGAGILGCGGGGNPRLARILAIKSLRRGNKIRIMTPSRFLQNADPENDLVSIVAYMDAPSVIYEKLVSGTETTGALHCMQDIYDIGGYQNGMLVNSDGVTIKKEDGVTFIDDYKVQLDVKGGSYTKLGNKRIVALMSAEIGGLNCIEPLIVGASLGLPILDCDGMGRAFPELQMLTPFIYGNNPYPATLVDDKGRRAVVLYADGPKSLENHFRKVVTSMGCSGGVVLSHFNKDQVKSSAVQYSLSHAWRIGDTVIRARAENKSAVEAVVKSENGKMLIYGKISDVQRETTGGFNEGKIVLQGLGEYIGKIVSMEFKNEFLVAREVGVENNRVLACVPDLITLMYADTAEPIPTEEVRFGIRVAVVVIPASPMITSEQALKFVSPQAFGYGEDVKYKPLCDFVDAGPIAPK